MYLTIKKACDLSIRLVGDVGSFFAPHLAKLCVDLGDTLIDIAKDLDNHDDRLGYLERRIDDLENEVRAEK